MCPSALSEARFEGQNRADPKSLHWSLRGAKSIFGIKEAYLIQLEFQTWLHKIQYYTTFALKMLAVITL